MAGYKPNRTFHVLDFSETELAGLEITARASSVEDLLKLVGVAGQLRTLDQQMKALADGDDADMDELQKQLRSIFAPFARVLKSWNVLDDDGEPVPATLDGLLSQELEFVSQVIEAYVSALAAAPPPLQGNSPSGASSPEETALDLAAASKSLPS
jgi:hypothetical protein